MIASAVNQDREVPELTRDRAAGDRREHKVRVIGGEECHNTLSCHQCSKGLL